MVVARDRSLPPFLGGLPRPLPKLLLDTTVYLDELQGRLPQEAEVFLPFAKVWYSTVTEAELMAFSGLLSRSHSGTRKAVQQAVASVERRPAHRILNPDREVWRAAGILAGLIARLQQYGKQEQWRALSDALILLSAEKHGFVVLARNTSDCDLLMRLAPKSKPIFY